MSIDRATRLARALGQKKSDKREITSGTPKMQEMKEGARYTSLTTDGLSEFIKHNGSLFKMNYQRVEQPYGGTMNDAVGKEVVTGTNGKVTIGGIVIQWGRYGDPNTANSNATIATVTFPTPFPTACLSVVATNLMNPNDVDGTASGVGINWTQLTKKGFQASVNEDYEGLFWIAIGH